MRLPILALALLLFSTVAVGVEIKELVPRDNLPAGLTFVFSDTVEDKGEGGLMAVTTARYEGTDDNNFVLSIREIKEGSPDDFWQSFIVRKRYGTKGQYKGNPAVLGKAESYGYGISWLQKPYVVSVLARKDTATAQSTVNSLADAIEKNISKHSFNPFPITILVAVAIAVSLTLVKFRKRLRIPTVNIRGRFPFRVRKTTSTEEVYEVVPEQKPPLFTPPVQQEVSTPKTTNSQFAVLQSHRYEYEKRLMRLAEELAEGTIDRGRYEMEREKIRRVIKSLDADLEIL